MDSYIINCGKMRLIRIEEYGICSIVLGIVDMLHISSIFTLILPTFPQRCLGTVRKNGKIAIQVSSHGFLHMMISQCYKAYSSVMKYW